MAKANGNVWAAVIITFFSTIVLCFIVLYAGCNGMSKYIANKRTCNDWNIDNYELRTHTDIPKTKTVDCNYDASIGVKSTVFVLDLSEENLIRSIEYNQLKKVTECTQPNFKYNPLWNDSISKLPQEHLYTKWGSDREDNWIYVLDSMNQTLWAELVEDKSYID